MRLIFEIQPSIFGEYTEITLTFQEGREGLVYTQKEMLDNEFTKELLPRCIDSIFYEAKRKVKERILLEGE